MFKILIPGMISKVCVFCHQSMYLHVKILDYIIVVEEKPAGAGGYQFPAFSLLRRILVANRGFKMRLSMKHYIQNYDLLIVSNSYELGFFRMDEFHYK